MKLFVPHAEDEAKAESVYQSFTNLLVQLFQ